MLLFIGLGNPGIKFKNNRHNIGFMVIDNIHKINNFPKFSKKFDSYFSIKNIFGINLILTKPTTYMNNSGISISKIKSFYKLDNENIFVFHDEIDLSQNIIKLKTGGGHNGHNGLKSLDNNIGKNYHRIRIGIGKPVIEGSEKKNELVSNWVLSNFSNFERSNWLNKLIEKITTNCDSLINKDFNKFMQKYKG